MSTLFTEFLTARIREDIDYCETLAKIGQQWRDDGVVSASEALGWVDKVLDDPAAVQLILRWKTALVLSPNDLGRIVTEAQAKLEIVEVALFLTETGSRRLTIAADAILDQLSWPYRSHPDYPKVRRS